MSQNNKSILKRVSINQLRSMKEQGRQQLLAQINRLPSEQQEAARAGLDLALIFIDEYFVKDLLDILCNNKGNYIVKNLLLRISQQIDKFVEIEDNTEMDEATYQQLKGNIEAAVRLVSSGLIPEFGPTQIENLKQTIRQTSREELGISSEHMRKFFLKVLDNPELDQYLQQVPVAWRSEVKTLCKSFVNLAFAVFDRDLIYDLLPVLLDFMDQAMNQKVIDEQQAQARIFPILTKHLKKWVRQGKLYIKKSSSSPSSNHLTQQVFDQLNQSNSEQINQLQEEITRLHAQIRELELEKQSSNNSKPEINFPMAEEGEIWEKKRELEQKRQKLERIKHADEENPSSKQLQLFHSNLELNELAKKLEQFDHKQKQTNQWSGGTIALIAVGCFLGGGLIVFLLWLAFRKKKET